MRRARERVAGVNLTTDVIVGHPAETEAAFAATLGAVGEAGFTKVHVFPYSPRPGTTDGHRPASPRPSSGAAAAGCARSQTPAAPPTAPPSAAAASASSSRPAPAAATPTT